MKRKIAVFGNAWSNDYLEQIIEGMRREAKKDCSDIFLFVTYILTQDVSHRNASQMNIYHLPNPRDFDGAILLTNTFNLSEEYERILALFRNSDIPILSLEIPLPGVAYIGSENYKGMYGLVEHLVEKHGAKRFVYVAGIKGNQEDAIRERAVRNALAKYGYELADRLQGDFGFYAAEDVVGKWIQDGNELPDAFICANDLTAIGAYSALDMNNYDVPRDTIVTGFDHISDGRMMFPMLATVSRGWEKMGEYAYKEIMKQIDFPDPSFKLILESSFVPSESCGCPICAEDEHDRLQRFKRIYINNTESPMLDGFFQELRVALDKVDCKENFFGSVGRILEQNNLYLGPNMAICTEPQFFELDDAHYPARVRGYSEVMDVLFYKKDRRSMPSFTFNSRTLVPGYEEEPDKSNIYVFTPLNYINYVIGYVVFKNNVKMLYDLTLHRWVVNMNSLFVNLRQYIFAQKAFRELKGIYMTDFLTSLYNRTGCDEVLYDFIEKGKAQERTTALIFADIDRMKLVNDNYGHLEGDVAIKATADALRKSLPEDWLCARYGGDEFIAVGYFDEEDIDAFSTGIHARMEKYIADLHLSFPLSASIGGTVINPCDKGNIEDYIEVADSFMYTQKKKAHERIDKMNFKKK